MAKLTVSTSFSSAYRLAVLVPCRNEALTITQVVTDFRQQLPNAAIYVYDNCSTDDTATVAQQAGAIVRYEKQPGKGNVIRRMFADIEADIYILVDGDNTYEAEAVGRLIDRLINEQLDMVVGAGDRRLRTRRPTVLATAVVTNY
ncbi:glycosyltransferase [Synechocystis sp. B12]|nr:glycosyltransferase [Synechocystis sp. B12]